MASIYKNETYLQWNPTWHEEDSPWKADQIMQLLEKHPIEFQSVAEIGCGVGEVLNQLRTRLPAEIDFQGYDIAHEAITRAELKACDRLQFHEEDLLKADKFFDLLLAIDVVEHIPDYYRFLDECRQKAKYKLYHIPLEVNILSVLRASFAFTLNSGRNNVGHLHFFTAESALMALAESGHRIIGFSFTPGGIALARLHPSLKRTLANAPRRMVSSLSDAWAARLVGGYSLLALTE